MSAMEETVTLGRSRRSTAGNRMRELLEKAHQQDDDELFAEEEGDAEFEAPQEARDVFLDEFADTDDEAEVDEEEEERRIRREERRKAKGKSKAIYNPLGSSSVKIKKVQFPTDPTSSTAASTSTSANVSLLDPSIDPNSMAPSTLVLALRKQRREQKRLNRSQALRSTLRASTLRTETDVLEKEQNEKLNPNRKGRRAQHETGEIRIVRKMTQAELIAEALEEEERNKEALRDWVRREEARRELRRVGRKRVRGPRWTWISRTVGKLVEEVEETKDAVVVSKEPTEPPVDGFAPKSVDSTPAADPQPQETLVSTASASVTDAGNPSGLAETPFEGYPNISTVSTRPDAEQTGDAPTPTGPTVSDESRPNLPATAQTPSHESVEPTINTPLVVESIPSAPHGAELADAHNSLEITRSSNATQEKSPILESNEAAEAPSPKQPVPDVVPEPASTNAVAGPSVQRADSILPQATSRDSAVPTPDAVPVETPNPENNSQYTRNYIILSQIPGGLAAELKLILGDHVEWDEVKYIPHRNRPINRRPTICPFTGMTAKYRHPVTMTPYATIDGFRQIEAILNYRYVWNEEASVWFGGEEDISADEVDGVEGWNEAIHGGWMGGKEILEEERPEPEQEQIEDVVMEDVAPRKGKRKVEEIGVEELRQPANKKGKSKAGKSKAKTKAKKVSSL